MEQLKTEQWNGYTIFVDKVGFVVEARAFKPYVAPQYLQATALGKTKEIAMERLKAKLR